MKIVDLSTDTTIKQINSEFCIVGSGPGGGVLAVELLKKGINVTLLEQGGDYRNSDFSETVDKFNIEGDMDVSFGHSREVGGSSNLWAGRVSKLEERDLNRHSSEGWPIEYSELEHFYDQALKILNLSNSFFVHLFFLLSTIL